MKYLFVFILTIINIFFLIWFIGGIVIIFSLLASGKLFALLIILILTVIGGLLLLNLSKGLLHFIKVNDFKCTRVAPIIDIKMRESLALNLICIEIGVLLLASCGFMPNKNSELGLSWLFIRFVASLIPGMIIWLYSIKDNPPKRVKDIE